MTGTLWIYFIIFSVLLPLWGLMEGRRSGTIDIFHPVTLTFNLAMLTIGWRIMYIVEYKTALVDKDDLLISGLFSLTLFFVVGMALYLFIKPLIAPSIAFRERLASPNKMQALIVAYFFFGTLLISILIFRFGGIQEVFSNVMGFMSEGFESSWSLVMGYKVTQIASCASMLLWAKHRTFRGGALTLLLCLLTMALGVTGGYRSYVFSVILYCICAWSCLYKPVRLRTLVGFVLLIVFTTPVLNVIRFENRAVDWLSGDSVMGVFEEADFGVQGLITSVSSRFIALDAHCRVWDMMTHGDVEVQYGKGFWEFPFTLIPRVLYPNKPSTIGVQMTDHFFSDVYPSGTGTTTSMMGFLFWQFGWIGVIASPLIFALFLAFLASWYENMERDFGNVLIYTVLLLEIVMSLWQLDVASVGRFFITLALLLPLVSFGTKRKIAAQAV